jgi:hypothetical protein
MLDLRVSPTRKKPDERTLMRARLYAVSGPPRRVSEVLTQALNRHTPSLLDLRSPHGTGRLFILLFPFQFSFLLWIKLGLFLLFPFAFISFALVAHLCFSFLENELRRTVGPRPRVRWQKLVCNSTMPKGLVEKRGFVKLAVLRIRLPGRADPILDSLKRADVAEVFGPVILYVRLFLDLGEPILVGLALLLLQDHEAERVFHRGEKAVVR